MKKWMKQYIMALVAVFLIGNGWMTIASAEEKIPGLQEGTLSAIMIEQKTGKVLYEYEPNKQLPPASMTKIMTMLLVMEALEEGKITLEDKVIASERAASMGGSQIFLEEGEEMTVDELLKGVAIASGNDASVALAEYIEGSVEEFVEKMNERAEALGLKHTTFKNPTGLPEEGHVTTAHDLAVMSQALLEYEDILNYTKIYDDYLRKGKENEFWLVNTNRLVKFYDGVDGLKTGYTKEAKYNLTATAKRGNMRVITVLMGADTPKERNKKTTDMLDFAFQRYEYQMIHEENEVMGEVAIEKGRKTKVPAVLKDTVGIVIPKGKNVENVSSEITWKKDLIAPLKKGTVVGTVTFMDGENKLVEEELILQEDAAPANWFVLFKRTLSSFMGDLRV